MAKALLVQNRFGCQSIAPGCSTLIAVRGLQKQFNRDSRKHLGSAFIGTNMVSPILLSITQFEVQSARVESPMEPQCKCIHRPAKVLATLARYWTCCCLCLCSVFAQSPASNEIKPDYSREAFVSEEDVTHLSFETMERLSGKTTARIRINPARGSSVWRPYLPLRESPPEQSISIMSECGS